jgi:hypothetical protein
MFKWLKDLFRNDPHPTWQDPHQWIRMPDLSIAVDIYSGELSFGDGSSTSLGQDMSTLSPLGPPDEKSGATLVYQTLGIRIAIEDEGIEEHYRVGEFNIDFRDPIVVPCLINGRPAHLSTTTTIDEVIALLNDLPEEVEPYIADDASMLTCGWNNSFFSQWHFEAGKLGCLTLSLIYG